MTTDTATTIAGGVFDRIDDDEPAPSVITHDNVFDPATPYELWLMKLIYRDPRRALGLYQDYIQNMPVFDGPADGADIRPPNVAVVDPPRYWTATPIHFTDHNEPRWLRVNVVSGSFYTFTHPDRARALFARIFGDMQPKRIMDLGCGLGGSTFALAKLFPDAEVIGVDLSKPSIRADRERAARDGINNVQFYYANAQITPYDPASFDIVNESYVLHEMPQVEAQKMVAEMKRLVRPGGCISVVDVVVAEDDPAANDAKAKRGASGPEPFLPEYMKLNIRHYLADAGFTNIQRIQEPDWDAMAVVATRPE